MSPKSPNLEKLNDLFRKGESFELTDAQYEKRTGTALPKDKSYLLHRSALSRKCAEEGYTLTVIEKTVRLTKK